MIFFSTWGALIAVYEKCRMRRFSLMEIIGEVSTSAFLGIIVFWLCEAGDLKLLVTAALIGISAHMGSRGVFMLENMIEKKFNKVADLDV